jgi:hypothetical protein
MVEYNCGDMVSKSPVLNYAPGPRPTVQRDPYRLVVTVPPVPRWRALPGGFKVAAGVPVFMLVMAALRPLSTWAWVSDMLIALLVAAGVAAATYNRLQRWVEFVVTADALTVRQRVGRFREWTESWPRNEVMGVSVGFWSRRLELRIRDAGTTEIDVGPNAADAKLVGQTLEGALREHFSPFPAEESHVPAAGNAG